eukprot:Seg748.5 transcript_id=Seg748.5/GoldUCD/mRNA.D3Y31 product="hypothetical protein" protein_id=Seg748.5/GoldUCD/D3Y31
MYFATLASLAFFLTTVRFGECSLSLEDSAVSEIEEVFSGAEFKKLINWIDAETICLRRGEKAENACYMLNDNAKGPPGEIDMKDMRIVMKWTIDPLKNQELCKRWYQRLWNSLAFILAIEKSGKCPLLLAKAAASENERYIPGKGGIGDKETFSKGMVDKGKLISEIKVLDAKEAAASMPATVKSVMQWMKESMP